MNDLWDVILTQEASRERFRRLSVSVPLKKDVEHEALLVHRSPEPVSDAIDARADLVHMPPGTPSGFPVAQVFCEEGSELDTPLAQGFVTDLDAALVEQFLNVPVAQTVVRKVSDGLDPECEEVGEQIFAFLISLLGCVALTGSG